MCMRAIIMMFCTNIAFQKDFWRRLLRALDQSPAAAKCVYLNLVEFSIWNQKRKVLTSIVARCSAYSERLVIIARIVTLPALLFFLLRPLHCAIESLWF